MNWRAVNLMTLVICGISAFVVGVTTDGPLPWAVGGIAAAVFSLELIRGERP